jgi:hypothetical protein
MCVDFAKMEDESIRIPQFSERISSRPTVTNQEELRDLCDFLSLASHLISFSPQKLLYSRVFSGFLGLGKWLVATTSSIF